MKKIIYRFILIIIFVFVLLTSYLSIIGIETNKLNKQIENQIKSLDENLGIELNKVKIILDPFNFKINIKTVGSKIKYNEKIVDLESIKTQISINSFVNKNFLLSNLEVSTKSLEIKNLISLIRSFENKPELYILEKFVKKGYVIADIKLEFDAKGNIKNNYSIIGFINNFQIDLFKKYKIDKLNLAFNVKNKDYDLQDINLLFNDISFVSEKILIKKINDYFSIKGVLENKNIKLGRTNIDLIKNTFNSNLNIEKLSFNSKNKFSFKILEKYKIDNLKFVSEIGLNELIIENNLQLKKIFPKVKKKINFNNHKIKLDYDKKNLFINGDGNILFQTNNDKIKYNIKKNSKKSDFSSYLTISDNEFLIDILNFKKKNDSKLKVSLDGSYFSDKKTTFNVISLEENKNKIIINNLVIDKDLKFESLKSGSLNYLDIDEKMNKVSLFKKKKNYFVEGLSFNANSLIKNLVDDNKDTDLNIFKENFNITLDIDKVFLDKKYKVDKLKGLFYIKKNKILNANLDALFDQNKVLKFTIDTNQEGKVTTLFMDNAEPMVNRYKFIKGFENGSLDFYSFKKRDKTVSTLKIYDFKLKELPVLTKLLTLASLQGIADTLSGEGIRFNEFEMNFENQKNLITIKEIYAIGPAISLLMDGYVEKNKMISLRGTLVPATTLNKVIGSIPLLGKILVGSKSGEGVFGVSFKIKGPPKNLETTVNPIKTLTPRFITRTLEKIKK